MKYRTLGDDGPRLSVVGLGCNNFGMVIDEAQSKLVVDAALDAGINHFDTAESYGAGKSEEYLGKALGARRSGVIIATKYKPRTPDEPYSPGLMAARIRESAEGCLSRLGTDYIDLFYQHRPDAEAPPDEVLGALEELVRSGKVLHIASSNVSAEQIEHDDKTSRSNRWARFSGIQIEWSLLSRDVEKSVVPTAISTGLGVVPYFPLASGLLTGKYRKGEPFPEGTRFAFSDRFSHYAIDENFAKVEAYERFAAEHGRSIAELAVGWLLAQPAVTSVITGATKPEQIAINASVWELTPTEATTVAGF
jgi:aryl-alcohol dehydrogenase-like predicted oxidoreductase